jgi:hypothetical protein
MGASASSISSSETTSEPSAISAATAYRRPAGLERGAWSSSMPWALTA